MVRPDTTIDSIADLPFLIFVAVADANHAVGAVEADAFFDLLHARAWATCPALASALPESEKRYADHWKRYVSGRLPATPAAVLHAIKTMAARISSEQAPLLEHDLLHIADVLGRAVHRPRLTSDNGVSHATFAQIEAVLKSMPVASATKADAAKVVAVADTPATDEAALEASVIAGAEPWDSVRTRLRVVRIVNETSDVKTFYFTSDAERPFSYKPGQFLTLEVEIDGKKLRRNYTIASSPSRPLLLALTVKRIPGGIVSNWLHDRLTLGDTLPAVVANGKFNCWDIQAPKVLLLSAGIGITPVMSMARWQSDLCLDRDTVFFHITRTPSAIVFRSELELLEGPHFKLILNCTRPAPDEEWNGLSGRLDAEALKAAVPDYGDRVIFMCGPDAWMKAMREQFGASGMPAANIHEEYFGPRSWATTAPAPGAVVATAGRAKVVFARSNKEVECATDEPILEVAERSGIEIASSCRVGACGTCKVIKSSGTVHNGFCPGLADTEAQQGYILTCSTTAEGTVVVDA